NWAAGAFIAYSGFLVIRLLEAYREAGMIGIRFARRSASAFFSDASNGGPTAPHDGPGCLKLCPSGRAEGRKGHNPYAARSAGSSFCHPIPRAALSATLLPDVGEAQ